MRKHGGNMNAKNLTIAYFLLALVLVPGASAQKLKIDPEQRYLLLATQKTSTMQKELNEAAALGFRVVAGSPTSGTEMALMLARGVQPEDAYTYRLLATTRTSTMQEELDEAASDGFRLLPQTMIAKKGMLGPTEIVVILERPQKVEKRYKYKLLATRLTSTLQKEVAQAEAAGFVPVGMVSRGEHLLIMEQETEVK